MISWNRTLIHDWIRAENHNSSRQDLQIETRTILPETYWSGRRKVLKRLEWTWKQRRQKCLRPMRNLKIVHFSWNTNKLRKRLRLRSSQKDSTMKLRASIIIEKKWQRIRKRLNWVNVLSSQTLTSWLIDKNTSEKVDSSPKTLKKSKRHSSLSQSGHRQLTPRRQWHRSRKSQRSNRSKSQ